MSKESYFQDSWLYKEDFRNGFKKEKEIPRQNIGDARKPLSYQ